MHCLACSLLISLYRQLMGVYFRAATSQSPQYVSLFAHGCALMIGSVQNGSSTLQPVAAKNNIQSVALFIRVQVGLVLDAGVQIFFTNIRKCAVLMCDLCILPHQKITLSSWERARSKMEAPAIDLRGRKNGVESGSCGSYGQHLRRTIKVDKLVPWYFTGPVADLGRGVLYCTVVRVF
jgi:hypothetical protein